MEKAFMSIKNSKTKESNKFFMNLLTSVILKIQIKILHQLIRVFITHKKISNLDIATITLHEFKIFAPTWNDEFDLPDQILFQAFMIILSVLLKHETIADASPVQIYVNKIKNRVVFKIKTDYKLELLTVETMKFIGSINKDEDQNKNDENVPKLNSAEVVLVIKIISSFIYCYA